ncbi:unnamed protein product (macronuclear) [Paramecium tetraurelia]|uniref:Uncharacterized protein n=1 Tax=Paramecium tetraurelia TaxID=5888 RepID=A0D031_PARTE|nr:uncharacterized protein GSPATT00039146001 [Paramecium tetraurelia]CAK76398.1 unnamed protein product [Paramecium tetraurelia]|eukprot:XP_001443795.1 hypothetical protein (macronuclear) [Paramecium tetraurelia strain d4-2]
MKSSKCCLAFDKFITGPRGDGNREQIEQHFERDDFNLLCRGKININKNNEDAVRVYQDVGNASLKSSKN